jgi:uncharacterized membrane protein
MIFEFKIIKGLGPVGFLTIFKRTYAMCICHHMEDRSFHFFGIEKYLCSRCLGILIGFILGLIGRFIDVLPSFGICILLIVPLIVDGMLQAHTSYISTNNRRFVTGLLFGFGLAFILKFIKMGVGQ